MFTAMVRHSISDAADTARRLAAAFDVAGLQLPDVAPVLLPDGGAGVRIGPVPAALAARLAERLEEWA